MKIAISVLFLIVIAVIVGAYMAPHRIASDETAKAYHGGPGRDASATPAPATTPAPSEVIAMPSRTYSKPSDEELRKKLSAVQYRVTQQSATEPPFRNEFWDNHEAGLYVDITTGEPLFSSQDKFNSGTGWPSFTRPVDKGSVLSNSDTSHGMVRDEVRSRAGDAHLGHVFDDGPAPTGLRYCINSASLKFIPVAKLADEGYGEYARRFDPNAPALPANSNNACAVPKPGQGPSCKETMDVAVLAGGCFWGMEEIIRKIPGVIDTEVGYAGGTTANPTYNDVKTGKTGHAESIKVTFDTSKLSYDQLLEKWFFKMHDPTTKNQQGNDAGSQYRSAIFYANDAQKKTAEAVIARVNASGKWKAPIVTEVAPAGAFTKAEDYHQHYLQTHPGGYTCHFMRE